MPVKSVYGEAWPARLASVLPYNHDASREMTTAKCECHPHVAPSLGRRNGDDTHHDKCGAEGAEDRR